MAHHLILNKVEFHPETNMIKIVSDNKEISLFSTASRCLELLITQQGSIIPQRELMAFAWADHGLSVSPNTFYQNISSLRKSLAELIPDENIIVTVKRVGLTIPEHIEIKRVSDTSPPRLAAPPSVDDEQKPPYEVASHTKRDNNFHSFPHDKTSILSKKNYWVPLWILIVLISGALLIKGHYFSLSQSKIIEDPFRNYTFYKKINENCAIFVNPDSGQIDPDNTLLNIPQSGCKGYDRVYVTLHEGTMTRSAMYCMVTQNRVVSCVSAYIVRDKNEKKT